MFSSPDEWVRSRFSVKERRVKREERRYEEGQARWKRVSEKRGYEEGQERCWRLAGGERRKRPVGWGPRCWRDRKSGKMERKGRVEQKRGGRGSGRKRVRREETRNFDPKEDQEKKSSSFGQKAKAEGREERAELEEGENANYGPTTPK